MTVQAWPTIVIPTAPSTADTPANGAVALQLGGHRYHLTRDQATGLLSDLADVLTPVRLGPAARPARRTIDDLVGGAG